MTDQEKREKAINEVAAAYGIDPEYLRSKLEYAENRLGMPLYPRLRPTTPKRKSAETPLSPKQFGIKRK